MIDADGPLGIYLGFNRRVPVLDRIAMIRAAGFGALSLWWDAVDGPMRQLRDAAVLEIERNRLSIDSVHVPYRGCNALWSADADERLPAIERHQAWLEDCAEFGFPRMVMHVSQGTRAELDVAAGLESFASLVDAAEEQGVTIGVENTRGTDVFRTLLRAMDSPALGLCYDSSHDVLYDDSPYVLLDEHGRRLSAVHLSDTDGRLDRHWIPGEGIVDFGVVMDAVAAAPQPVVPMLEVAQHDREEDPREFLRRAYERLEERVEATISTVS